MTQETYRAICINAHDSGGLLIQGKEYTVLSRWGGSVSLHTAGGPWRVSRFQRAPDAPATTPAPTPPEAAVAPAGGLAGTLAARDARYGSFGTNGKIAQELKAVMRRSPKWGALSGAQAEALDMFASKISRILTGDPDYADNWHDIAGYATRVEATLG